MNNYCLNYSDYRSDASFGLLIKTLNEQGIIAAVVQDDLLLDWSAGDTPQLLKNLVRTQDNLLFDMCIQSMIQSVYGNYNIKGETK